MPLRRIAVLVAAFAVACAPGPDIDRAGNVPLAPTTLPTVPRDTVPPTPTRPGTDPFPSIPFTPPPDLPDAPNGVIDELAGRAVLRTGTATIRTGFDAIALDEAGSPTQPTWSRDGERLVLLRGFGPTATVAVFDGRSGELIAQQAVLRPYFFFSWSHDGTRIAALGPGAEGTTLDILDADGTLLHDDVARAQALWVAWDPASPRLAVHADERLLRVDADGTATDLASVGTRFYAPKWIPGTDEIVLVVDVEGSDTLVRRGIDGGDTLVPLGPVETETGIVVNPDGRTAAVTILFDEDPTGGSGRRTALGPPTVQETPTTSGRVDIVDLETGERVPVFTGHARWVEWNPAGDRLLIGTNDVAAGTAAWWVYQHDDPFAAAEAGDAPEITAVIESYAPTAAWFGSYLVFADQYVEQPRLWSPTGDRFIFTEATDDGGWAITASATGAGADGTIGEAEVAFWSPVP